MPTVKSMLRNSITLEQIIREKNEDGDPILSELWVLNNAANQGRDGVVTFRATDDDEGQMILVPATWVPVDIGRQLNRDSLLRARDFRRALDRNILKLVRAVDAHELFAEDDEAQAESDRVAQQVIDGTVMAMIDEPEIKKQPEFVDQRQLLQQKLNANKAEPEYPDSLNVNPRIVEIINRTDVTGDELYAFVTRGVKSAQFSTADMNYIVKYCSDAKSKAMVVNALAEK